MTEHSDRPREVALLFGCTQGRNRNGGGRGLCIRGAIELVRRTFPGELLQVDAHSVGCLVERAHRGRAVFGETTAHATCLRALAGEEPRDTARPAPGPVVNRPRARTP